MPTQAHDICQLYFDGKAAESEKLQKELLELVNNLFIEVNPIPVKTAMNLLGWCSEEIRLPLCEMEDDHLATLKASMKKYGLIK
jgi:4-hydroxy-tetrahydrodipicolinate synthase